MLIVFASPFRIVVTFAIVLEVRGIILLPNTMNCLRQKFTWTERSQPECSWWVLHSNCESASPSSSAWVIRKKYVELVQQTNPCVHNSESYMLLELSIFSCIPTITYQLIVKSMCAIMFINAYYSCGTSSRSGSEWLGETNSSTSSIPRIGSK